jgi:hypothetical protein
LDRQLKTPEECYDKYSDKIYEVIEDACQKVDLSVGHNHTIEIDTSVKMIDAQVEKIMALMDDYRIETFMQTCKSFGFRELCNHCKDRFLCLTER